MERKEFLKICSILGIGLPILNSCNSIYNDKSKNKPKKVVIIGAGPAGMTAAYLLHQQGIDFKLLEASESFGGRMACTTSISNFPTPHGAEWVHTSDDVFSEIANNPSVDTSNPKLVGYGTNDLQDVYSNGELRTLPLGEEGAGDDRKFIDSCWKDFFSEYIIPSISDKLIYNAPVSAIDYTADIVKISAGNNTYEADKCIVTVPLKILQEGSINFTPPLPSSRQKAISSLKVMPGFKCFLKTSQKFYSTYLLFDDSFIGGGQWIYYDAAYGQNTNDNILGFLCVGPKAVDYPYKDANKLREHITSELKDIYGSSEVDILDFEYTDWDKVPYIKGSYLGIETDPETVASLAEPIDSKIYFAGSAYTKQNLKGKTNVWGYSINWSNVHAATRAAKRAVDELVGS